MGGGRLSPPAAFGEFCKLIFIKVRDEKWAIEQPDGTPYRFQIKTEESDADLGARIRRLYDEERAREPDVFTEGIKIDDATLRRASSIWRASTSQPPTLIRKVSRFERFLDGFFKGDFGQYFTPREIIQFCIAMMPPGADDRVLDTSCGSGGFLLYAMDHVRHWAEQTIGDAAKAALRWHQFAEQRLFGIEINDEISRVAKMNMILHDDGHTNVIAADALDTFEAIARQRQSFKPASYDLILTNPPFGAVVRAAEKGQAFIDRFELASRVGKQAGDRGEKQKAGKACGQGARQRQDRSAVPRAYPRFPEARRAGGDRRAGRHPHPTPAFRACATGCWSDSRSSPSSACRRRRSSIRGRV